MWQYWQSVTIFKQYKGQYNTQYTEHDLFIITALWQDNMYNMKKHYQQYKMIYDLFIITALWQDNMYNMKKHYQQYKTILNNMIHTKQYESSCFQSWCLNYDTVKIDKHFQADLRMYWWFHQVHCFYVKRGFFGQFFYNLNQPLCNQHLVCLRTHLITFDDILERGEVENSCRLAGNLLAYANMLLYHFSEYFLLHCWN